MYRLSFVPVVRAQGNLNNNRVVAPSVQFSISAPEASQVLVVGDWDNWQVGGDGGREGGGGGVDGGGLECVCVW